MFSEPARKGSLPLMDLGVWDFGSTRTRFLTLKKKFSFSRTFSGTRSLEAGQKLAASDGELSSSDVEGRGSRHSLTSLPSGLSPRPPRSRAVASWAVSFEHLLQDPLGVAYFTEFLKKEFSAENIFFWQACERFQHTPAHDSAQLARESRRIYDEYLSTSSLNPVNIDHQACLGEGLLDHPTPDMFRVQQMQIFNLMKFDSYARFVRSQVYQECILAEVEGRTLPVFGSAQRSPRFNDGTASSDFAKKPLKAGKSLPLGVEAAGADAAGGTFSERCTRRSFKKKDRKGMWGELADADGEASLRRRSQGSLNSSTSLDLGFLLSLTPKPEKDGGSVGSTDTEPETRPDTGPVKYCCVYLPDGTASLTAVRQGLSIREMLSGICQKRGLCIADVKLYMTGSKQKALVLDQDSTVLTDQEVALENRISFDLEIPVIKKVVRISAKSGKTVREALQPIAEKYGVSLQQVALYLCGESNALDLDRPITAVAGQRLVLGMIPALEVSTSVEAEKAKEQTHQGGSSPGLSDDVQSRWNRCIPAVKNPLHRRTYDIEGLVELLNRVQGCRVEDQRGLLSKEDLILPDFLQLPSKDTEDAEGPILTTSDPACMPEAPEPPRIMNPEVPAPDVVRPQCDLESLSPGITDPNCGLEGTGPRIADLKCDPQLPELRKTREDCGPEVPGMETIDLVCDPKSSAPTHSDLQCDRESLGSLDGDPVSCQNSVDHGLLPEALFCHIVTLPDLSEKCQDPGTQDTDSPPQMQLEDEPSPCQAACPLHTDSQSLVPGPDQHTS
ncbi:regulator of G-protein signaling 14 isoform X2 [Ambystoma mexicanum]|uniref:regulator of G-protein signaling 14 isoform X2 n=1 Tax=Ambystoma mexicanum TaxID=8296 RepID=UPI0037E89C56